MKLLNKFKTGKTARTQEKRARELAAREAEVLTQAVTVFGKEHQLRMLQEECGEAIVAINHYLRGRIPAEEVLSEIADVVILGRQAEVIFAQVLQPFITEKVERLAQHTANTARKLRATHKHAE
jgi:NTP pyrophosphatase (non-canonical NTP hydrolase)